MPDSLLNAPPDTPTEAETLYESRVVLEPRNLPALHSIMAPHARQGGQFAHKMIWTLFPDMPDARRPDLFLFHVEKEKPFTAIIRSRRPPVDGLGGIWRIEKIRPFDPQLVAGQRLRFRLRAVASHWQPQPGAKRGRREDVVVAAWRKLAEAERTPERLEETAQAACLEWLARQGARCGFSFAPGMVELRDYEWSSTPGKQRRRHISFGAVTYEGVLTVTEPVALRQALADGLGNGRAFGNGLMQIAPAP
ncbi:MULTISPECIES: type I-E CRISPR-associated protein Cas6/Cse3/CasE [unclassified Azospirillum]|uniref:type I-E CRISPR-associated protein Cas6/Cse3/CasE n=1 Tax=unclassified Azospirillum TaxID=2630922 RepID=UPI000B6D693F|nr:MULTISPECIES: type I-E CRISPR-associated protein Cas6/Cse3/CasE [unclassified Azospirillum]SNT19494.1 CRISPR-associated protein, Cse3 family [Azospirillum sp. RU38E]SNT31318.1 CRISPR-associated protein, Cse3 family [Azospirillum sp. RU37A]